MLSSSHDDVLTSCESVHASELDWCEIWTIVCWCYVVSCCRWSDRVGDWCRLWLTTIPIQLLKLELLLLWFVDILVRYVDCARDIGTGRATIKDYSTQFLTSTFDNSVHRFAWYRTHWVVVQPSRVPITSKMICRNGYTFVSFFWIRFRDVIYDIIRGLDNSRLYIDLHGNQLQ